MCELCFHHWFYLKTFFKKKKKKKLQSTTWTLHPSHNPIQWDHFPLNKDGENLCILADTIKNQESLVIIVTMPTQFCRYKSSHAPHCTSIFARTFIDVVYKASYPFPNQPPNPNPYLNPNLNSILSPTLKPSLHPLHPQTDH